MLAGNDIYILAPSVSFLRGQLYVGSSVKYSILARAVAMELSCVNGVADTSRYSHDGKKC